MMKKTDVIKHLPNTKKLWKEAQKKIRDGMRLIKEGRQTMKLCDILYGVTLYDGFPIRIITHLSSGGFGVYSGCDEVTRWGFVSKNNKKYTVTVYHRDDTNEDGIPIPGAFTKSKALLIAKEYVSKGKIENGQS